METAYEQRLREMVAELKGNTGLEIHRLVERPLDDYLGDDAAGALAKIGETVGMTLPPGLGANFHRFDDLHVAWRKKEPDGWIGGEFRLTDIAVTVVSPPPDWPADVARNDEERKLYQRFRFFDTQPVGGAGTQAAFHLAEDADPTDVWYYDAHHGFLKLDVDYGGYLDALLLTRGLYYWQYLFAEPAKALPRLATVVGLLAESFDFLTSAFPDDDFAELRDRLAARQQAVDEYDEDEEDEED